MLSDIVNVGGIDILCPTTTPQISSLGTLPCTAKLNAMSTHGNHGALKTSNPRKLSIVSGFRRLHMYTSTEESAVPRKAIEKTGASARRKTEAKPRRKENRAGERPEFSSSSRE